jgi:hypothetical protein
MGEGEDRCHSVEVFDMQLGSQDCEFITTAQP